MNRYIKYGLLCFAGGLFLTSCDVMDTEPKESYDESLVWSSKETADAFVYDTYNYTIRLYASESARLEGYTPNEIHSDLTSLDAFPTEEGIDRSYDIYGQYKLSKNNGNDEENAGFGFFKSLRMCNLIIKKAEDSDFTESQKAELIAEGKFLRGLVFFKQAQWVGRFVPIMKVLEYDDQEAFKTPLTGSIAESYELVMADIEAAIEDLPEESLSGSVNKYVAHAFRSRIALQAYAYTKDSKYIDKSIESATAVINSGKYTLTDNYGSMFQNGGGNNNEIILGYYRLAMNTVCSRFPEMINCVPNVNNDEITNSNAGPALKDANGRSFEGWASYFPTQDLVDQYLVIDKADGEAKVWYETSQYKNSVEDKNPASLNQGDFVSIEATGRQVPDADDMGATDKGQKIVRYGQVKDASRINEIMYENRDKRFYGTIVYDSCTWLSGETVTLCCQGNLWAGIRKDQADSWYTTASGYYWKKGVFDVSPRFYASNNTDYHFVLARLGEMYMNRAEAYLLKGEISKAVADLNMTRTVHGGLPASVASNEETAWKDYIRERRVEMAYEGGDLYFSYLRWGQYGGYANEGTAPGGIIQALNVPVHKIQITKDRKQYFVAQIVRNRAWNRNFSTKRYLLPIPQSQIDKRSASGIIDEQNPGW